MKVILRYDDFSARPHEGARGDVEPRLFDILARAGIPPLVAVVPLMAEEVSSPECKTFHDLRRNPESVRRLEDLVERGCQIGLHGLRHRARADAPLRTEFRGLSEAAQSRMIAEGIAIVEEAVGTGSVVGFVPPWDTYDAATVRAAAANGLQWICAGREWPCDSPVLPILTCSFTVRQLVDYLSVYGPDALEAESNGCTIIASFHDREFFHRSRQDFLAFDRFEESLRTLAEAGARFSTIDAGVTAWDCELRHPHLFRAKLAGTSDPNAVKRRVGRSIVALSRALGMDALTDRLLAIAWGRGGGSLGTEGRDA